MKVYLEPSSPSRGIKRVYNALIKYSPKEVLITSNQKEADLIIFHVIGRLIHLRKQIKDLKKPYTIIQYCLRSTIFPSTKDWIDLWKEAKLVWSYYDLPALCAKDGSAARSRDDFDFYHAPLGADAGKFKDYHLERKYIIATHGFHALQESVKEAVLAAKRVGREVFHLGHQLRRGKDITCITGISDEELARYYSQSEFVCGLRRIEGFEMPAVEGLLCGARPILFDKPHYRQWYDGLAVFIAEEPREKVIDSLELVFKIGTNPISEAVREVVKQRFNWERIIKGFWERIIS